MVLNKLIYSGLLMLLVTFCGDTVIAGTVQPETDTNIHREKAGAFATVEASRDQSADMSSERIKDKNGSIKDDRLGKSGERMERYKPYRSGEGKRKIK